MKKASVVNPAGNYSLVVEQVEIECQEEFYVDLLPDSGNI